MCLLGNDGGSFPLPSADISSKWFKRLCFCCFPGKIYLLLQKDLSSFLHYSEYYLCKHDNSNLWKCFHLERGYQLSLCTASPRCVTAFACLQIHLSLTSMYLFGVKSPDPWVHCFLIFLATWRKPCLSSKLNPLLQSTPSSEQLAQVPGLGRLRSQEAAAAHWVHQCQRYGLHSNAGLFVFLINSFKE